MHSFAMVGPAKLGRVSGLREEMVLLRNDNFLVIFFCFTVSPYIIIIIKRYMSATPGEYGRAFARPSMNLVSGLRGDKAIQLRKSHRIGAEKMQMRKFQLIILFDPQIIHCHSIDVQQ